MKDERTREQLVHELTELRSQNAALKKSITGSISAEFAAEEGRRYAESIVETIRELLLVLDADLKIILANRNFYRTFKVTPGETIGSFIYDLGNKQWAIPKLRELLETILPEKATFDNYEVEHDFADIGRRIMLLNARQIERASGKERIILLAIEDITERKRAEEALQANRRQLTDIIEFLPDATMAIDKEGRVIIWNKAIEKMTGIPAAEIIGKGGYAYTIPFYGEARPALMELVFENHEEIAALYPNITREGDTLTTEAFCNALYNNKGAWVFAKASPLHDQSGNIIGAIESIRDITERKELEEAHSQLAAIVESADDAIIGKDLEGTIVSWNSGAEVVYGYNAKEVIGKSISLLMPPGHPDEDKELLTKRSSGELSKNYETQRRRKDGQIIDVSLTISPVKDTSGKIIGISTITHDITEKKKLERDVVKARDVAEASNKELEAFSYSVSHDLRTPLRGIDGFSEALLDDYRDKLDATGKNYLERIRAGTQRMGSLIDDMLKLSRVSRAELKRESIDLSEMVQAILLTVRQNNPARDVKVSIQKDIIIDGDRHLLEIALTNLIDNAWKFTGKTKNARIEFGTLLKDGKPVIFIRDNGVGFDMAYVDKLFGAFQRLHKIAEFPGTGIGLANVQRVIHRHGGKIWAEGEVGKGATFYFTIPAEFVSRIS